MVTLAETTSPGTAVCTIFETLNRTGVKLSVFDLLAARFWPEDVRLRELWEECRRNTLIIADFEVDPNITSCRPSPSSRRRQRRLASEATCSR